MAVGIETEPEAEAPPSRPPRWPWVTGSVLSVLGLAVAAYLTYEHYTGSKSLSCPAGGVKPYSFFGLFHVKVDCFQVTTSVYSKVLGIPVADLGLVFFVVMAVLQSPWLWRRPELIVRAARVAWCVVGMATALKLIYDELHNLDAICVWCTSVHILTFLILVTTVLGTISLSNHLAASEPED